MKGSVVMQTLDETILRRESERAVPVELSETFGVTVVTFDTATPRPTPTPKSYLFQPSGPVVRNWNPETGA